MVKKGYKQTEVGVIPEDWEVMTMNSLTSLMTNGFVGTIKNEYVPSGTGVLYLQGFNVKENNFDLTGVTYISKEFHKKHLKSELRELDLLTVQTGNIGVTAYLPKEFEGANCQALIISRFQDDYDSRFWSYYFNSIGRKSLFLIETGSTMKHINVGDMKYVVVPVPTNKKEQKCIAEALSDVDSMISSLEKLIAKKKAVKQGAMQELLTGKKRLPGFTEEWIEKKVEEIVIRIATGLNPRQNFKLNNGETNYYVTIKDFKNGRLYLDDACDRIDDIALKKINERSDLRKGDLLFSSIGRIGDAYLITDTPQNWNINESVFTLRANDELIHPKMLYYILTSQSVKQKLIDSTTGSTLKSIKLGHLKSILCKFPKAIDEQLSIATLLSDMDNEIEALERKLAKTCHLKQGMMQQLLTGKIRLM